MTLTDKNIDESRLKAKLLDKLNLFKTMIIKKINQKTEEFN